EAREHLATRQLPETLEAQAVDAVSCVPLAPPAERPAVHDERAHEASAIAREETLDPRRVGEADAADGGPGRSPRSAPRPPGRGPPRGRTGQAGSPGGRGGHPAPGGAGRR